MLFFCLFLLVKGSNIMELPLTFPSSLFIWLVFASADEEQQVQPPVLLPETYSRHQ